ncbi:MAG: aminopeptidase P family protein [Oscillospiraceae bacterium]
MMIKKLQNFIKNNEAFDAAFICSPENRYYFTGFYSTDGYLIVTADRAIFITDSRYIENAEKKVKNCEVLLQTAKRSQFSDIFSELSVKKIAFEAERTVVSELNKFSKSLNSFEIVCDGSLDGAINLFRRSKTDFEIENMVKAQRIAEKAFSHICDFIKIGTSEKDIALELDFYMLKNGADALSFETIAVSGKNSSMPHGVPTLKKVEDGDFVTMDFGATVSGYHSDMTRTVAVGNISDKQREIYNIVLTAQKAALLALKPNISCKEADAKARDIIENAGYGNCFGHGTGHGVGIEIHENPRLSPNTNEKLMLGDVVTVEPGIYIPNEFGVRIEDMAYITENGCENLTNCPKELIIL